MAKDTKEKILDDSFDIGLSSHFLLMYTALGYDFHIKAMDEMLRLVTNFKRCKQNAGDKKI